MIKIEPKFREQVWGDFNLNKTFGIKGNPIGEVWLLSGHPLYTTNINGKTVNEASNELCGKEFKRFPLLIKLISTNAWLSLQVHPDDEYAQRVEGEPWGKSEAWYFLKDGEIAICEDPTLIPQALKSGNWEKVIRKVKVKKGTFVYIPAGVIHALGPNSTIIEVQQSSDLTYRIYDWGRQRELHIEKALQVAKKTKYENLLMEKISCEYFNMEELFEGYVDGFAVAVPKKIEKNFGAFLIPKGSKEFVRDSIIITLGEFFLNS